MREYKIRTANGYFDFANLQNNEILIEDIAQSLSKVNRFTGYTSRPYTVAMHSLYVAYLMALDGRSTRMQLLGLTHDFHEAYFSDMSSPLKWFLKDHYGFDANEYCDKIDATIYEKLMIPLPTLEEHAVVKEYDYRAYEHERYYLFDNGIENYMAEKITGDKPSTNVTNFLEFFQLSKASSIGHDAYNANQKYWEYSLIDVYHGMRIKLPGKVAYVKNVMDSVLAFNPEEFYANHGVSYVRKVVEDIVKDEENAIYKKVDGKFVRIKEDA